MGKTRLNSKVDQRGCPWLPYDTYKEVLWELDKLAELTFNSLPPTPRNTTEKLPDICF